MQKVDILKTDYCKKCGKPIVWTRTKKGRWMCLDEGLKRYRANKKGKDRVVTEWGETITCDILADDDKSFPTGMARVPHWATCPFADEFRKDKKKEEK